MMLWTFRSEARWMVVLYVVIPMLLLFGSAIAAIVARWLGFA
jgi:hypothetical protein